MNRSQPKDDFSDDEEDYTDPPPHYVTKPSKPATKEDGQAVKSILKKTKKSDPKPGRNASPEPAVPRISRAVRDKLADDDAEIAALEKKLGIKNKKKLPKSFEEDGLDDLLDGLDGDSEDDGKKRKRSEDDEWLKQKRRKVQPIQREEEPDDDDDDDEDEEEELDLDEDDDDEDGSINEEMDAIDNLLDGLGEDSGAEDDEEMDILDSEEDELSEEGDEDMDDQDIDEDGDDFEAFDEDDDEDEEDEESAPPAPRQRENPYVAPVSATSATNGSAPVPTGKYVPPSLRGPPSSDAEALQRLRRQLQGLLNRLSEANLISILQSVEKVYADNPRQYVTSTLIDLLLGLICDRTSLQDTFLILHAGFIAALYKVIGIDFGAQVIERIVSDFDTHYGTAGEDQTGKETANLMSLLSELYNFGVVGGNLVFDYIRLFLNSLSEANTELLLKIIRNSGPQLRSEDPSALKDIVVLLQKQVAVLGEANLSVRTKFMIETINNLKNNRMKTGQAASAVVSEHTTRMKKTIGTLNNRSTLKASEPLRIGLADIRDTEKKGKWWLVGASWMDPGKHETTSMQSGSPEQRRKEKAAPTIDTSLSGQDEGTTDLLTLARNQGMNTDIRRAIFITIMSASDFKDAQHRLLKLNFKKTQELEIPRVLIQCAGAEAVYNPYYTLIAKGLCGEKRMLKAFQFGLWDLFKRMGEQGDDEDSAGEDEEGLEEMGTRKIVNLARFFASLIVDAGVPITCLKTLNFAFTQPKTTTFLEVLLTTIILSLQKKSKKSKWELSLPDIFGKAQDVPDMIQGLRYFIENVVARGEIAKDKKERKLIKKGCESVVEALNLPVTGGGQEEDMLTSGDESD